MELNLKNPNSWHFQLYRSYGLAIGADWIYKRRDNACHYVQMVILAMLTRFLGIKLWREIRVWMIITAITSGVLIGLGLHYNPEITKRVLLIIGFLAGGAVFLVMFVSWLSDNAYEIEDYVNRFEPFYGPIIAFGQWAYSPRPKWRLWIAKILTTAIITTLVCLILGEGLLVVIVAMIILGIVAAIFGGGYLIIVVGIPSGVSAIQEKIGWKPRSTEIGFGQLTRRVWEAKKGSFICPFIKLPNWEE